MTDKNDSIINTKLQDAVLYEAPLPENSSGSAGLITPPADAAQEERDVFYMRLAMAQARLAASMSEIPVGAVIVDPSGAVIAQGCNRTLTNHEPSAHAEMLALRQAGILQARYRLTDLTLYVTLEPCIMCVGALIHARVKRVVFGAYDPKTGACGSMFALMGDKRHNHRIEVKGGVLYPECAAMLQRFFKERRKLLKAKKLSPSALSAVKQGHPVKGARRSEDA